MISTPAYTELIDFLARGSSPEDVIAFRPSEAAQQRVRELLEANRKDALSSAEASELSHVLMLEHIMRMAKIKARKQLQG